EEAFLELGIDPRARHETRTVGRRTRDEPVDGAPHVLPLDDGLLDQKRFERPCTRRGRGLAVGRDRVVRVVVIVLAHTASSQCSKMSTRVVSPAPRRASGQSSCCAKQTWYRTCSGRPSVPYARSSGFLNRP